MKIRSFEEDDVDAVKELHQKYYSDFDLPNFREQYLCAFVIGDDSPVCIGGVKTFAESVIVTDKSKSVKDRREALYRVLDISKFIAKQNGYDQLHAFIRDDEYLKVLLKRGFRLVNGSPVIIDLEN